MTPHTYSMSFTTGTLLLKESLTVATLYRELDAWDAVRKQVLDGNLLQMRTVNSSKRIFREISSRLKQLTQAEIDLLLSGSLKEQHYLLWLAVCKRYRFIYDFAVEVVHEKYLRLDFELTYDEYDIFFNNKAEWHPEVEGVAASTRVKQRQVIFKMLREAELLTDANQIIPALLSPRLIEIIRTDSPAHLAVFPISAVEIQEWTA